jgi:hypothetical protein
MSIQSVISVFKKIHEMTLEEAQDLVELTTPVYKEMRKCSAEAENLLTRSVSEEDLVVLMLMVQKSVTAVMMANGKGMSILMADAADELQSYTQTVILTTIGLLVQDEIL